ncbi:MAG TPA: hypothetical protein VFG30_43945 [Polyangiales bacterium]|nr:hypothetical protein [Polyangiales bacterium]
MRLVAFSVSLFACIGLASAQSEPAPTAAPTAPAPAAYQPAVLNPPAAEPPPPSATTTAPAAQPAAPAAPNGHFPAYPRKDAPSSAEQADIVSGRAALLRDRRFTPQTVDTAEVEPPVRHGDPRARWTVALSLDSVFYTDVGYDLFDDDNVSTRLGVWAGYDIAELAPRTTLAIELGFGAEAQEQGIWQGALRTQLESQTFSAGASLRYALFSWLDPQLRASTGITRIAFELESDDSNSFDDHALSGFGALSAGVLVHTPAQLLENRRGEFASLNIGLLIEGGYALRSSVNVDPTRKAADHAIPITEAELGELALSGPYVRSSVVVRF